MVEIRSAGVKAELITFFEAQFARSADKVYLRAAGRLCCRPRYSSRQACRPEPHDVRIAYADVAAHGVRDAGDLIVAAWAFHDEIAEPPELAAMLAPRERLAGMLEPRAAGLPAIHPKDLERYVNAAKAGFSDDVAVSATEGRWMLLLDLIAACAVEAVPAVATLANASGAFDQVGGLVRAGDSGGARRDRRAAARDRDRRGGRGGGRTPRRERSGNTSGRSGRRVCRGPCYRAGTRSDAACSRSWPRRCCRWTIHQPYVRAHRRWRRAWCLLGNVRNARVLTSAARVDALATADRRDDLGLAAFAIRHARDGGAAPAKARALGASFTKMLGPQADPQNDHHPLSETAFGHVADIAAGLPLTEPLLSRLAESMLVDRLTWAVSPIAYRHERARLIILANVAFLTSEFDARLRAAAARVSHVLSELPAAPTAALPSGVHNRYPRIRGFGVPEF